MTKKILAGAAVLAASGLVLAGCSGGGMWLTNHMFGVQGKPSGYCAPPNTNRSPGSRRAGSTNMLNHVTAGPNALANSSDMPLMTIATITMNRRAATRPSPMVRTAAG